MRRFKTLLFRVNHFSVLFVGIWFITTSSMALATTKHALIIGNSDYSGGFGLVTPRADSTAIASKLAQIGYKVHGGAALHNLDLDEFNNEIDSFLASVRDGASTLIYYAGHGAASAGSNYLIPILPAGVKLRSESDIRDRSISLQGILERVERRNPSGVNVFLFDACRDAPVEKFSRSINLTGLTNIDPGRQPRGSFIGFSTEYGKIALDGDADGNSPFAMAVLKSLETSASVPIELFFKEVTEQVYVETNGQQFPIQESKIRGQHCIIECNVTINPQQTQEYGTLSVLTNPESAEVCYLVKGWDSWNCGSQSVLPLNVPVQVKVTAKGYKPLTRHIQLNRYRQKITMVLEQKGNNTLRIIGGVAAVVAIGALLSSGSSTSSESSSEGDGSTTIRLIRP